MKKKGFTLIEILIVVSIIAVLAVILIVGYASAKKNSNDSKRIADLNTVAIAFKAFHGVNNAYPINPCDGRVGTPYCAFPYKAGNPDEGNWSTTIFNDLVSQQFIATIPKDPIYPTKVYYYWTPTPSRILLISSFEARNISTLKDAYIFPENPDTAWGCKVSTKSYCINLAQ